MTQKLSQQEQLTIQSYDQNAKPWSKGHFDNDLWIKERQLFKQHLPLGKILEIGCGGGRDARKLIALGYDYIGSDISKGLLEVARKNNPGANFLQQSVYDLDFPFDTFDGFWASAVLLHIPKIKIDQALQNIRKIVKSGGIGFISLKQGGGEKFIEEDRGEEGVFKRLFIFYSQAEFNEVLKRNNFVILYSDIHPPDGKTIWLTYLVTVVK